MMRGEKVMRGKNGKIVLPSRIVHGITSACFLVLSFMAVAGASASAVVVRSRNTLSAQVAPAAAAVAVVGAESAQWSLQGQAQCSAAANWAATGLRCVLGLVDLVGVVVLEVGRVPGKHAL